MRLKELHYLIPVDFTEAAYHAAQYALFLAKKAGGRITLVHILDEENIPAAANPVVVAKLIERTEKIKQQKLAGLQDIIQTFGIEVQVRILHGSFPETLLQYIASTQPDVTVVARKSSSYSQLIAALLQNTCVHVLIVPGSSMPEVPHRALVAADLSDTSRGFDMLVGLLVTMDQELALVHTDVVADDAALQEKLIRIRTKFGVEARLIKNREPVRSNDILQALERNPADWLCLVKKKQSNLFSRLIGSRRQEDITTQADVPVLVIRE
jgi:nucleotide-binding universal stress UspA family protein